MTSLRFGMVQTIRDVRYDGNPKDGEPYSTFSPGERLSFAQSTAEKLRSQGQPAEVVEVPTDLQTQAASMCWQGDGPVDILLLTKQEAVSFQEQKSTTPQNELILQALQNRMRVVQIEPTSGGTAHSRQGAESNPDRNLPEGTLIKNLDNGDAVWAGSGDKHWMSTTDGPSTSYVQVDENNQPIDNDGFPMRLDGNANTWKRLDVTQ